MEYEDTHSDDPRPVEAVEKEPAETEPKATSAPLLPIYLKEMGGTPLLTQEKEVHLARELQEARENVASLLLKLTPSCRSYVLKNDSKGPAQSHDWPLEELEVCWDRLMRYEREHRETNGSATVLRSIKQQKQRLDAARDALILANLRLVTHIAKKYGNQGVPFMDLIQEGNIGLMKAVEKFDHERGYRFSTYAYWWIKQAITRAIADKSRLIRIPVHVTEKVKKINRISARLSEQLGRKPTPQEIAQKSRLPLEQVDEILDLVQDPQSLESFGSVDETGVLPFVADSKARNPVTEAVDREMRDKMRSALRVLDAREREIIRLRFGLGLEGSHTLEAIGQIVNLSRERVRQIEAIALRKIQATRESQDLRRHLIA